MGESSGGGYGGYGESKVKAARPTTLDQMPPYNIDVEVGLLGMVMHDPSELHEVLTILDTADFFRATHQTVFEAIKARYNAGKPVDFTLVTEDMEKAGTFKDVGAEEAFGDMAYRGAVTANAREYAQITKQLSITRNLIDCGNAMLRDGYSRKYTAEELLTASQERFFTIAQGMVKDQTSDGIVIAREAWDLFLKQAEGEVSGVLSGLDDLDDKIGCIPNSCLTIVAARPSQGKTSLATNICEKNAFDYGVATLFISLEMHQKDIGMRIIASQAKVKGNLLKQAKDIATNPDRGRELDRLVAAREKLKNGRLFINDSPAQTTSQIYANVRLMKAKHNIGLVVIDYLSLINMQDRKGENRENAVARTCKMLKEQAKTLELPYIVICQLNRENEKREDRRPRMSDLRESGQIEQDADIILLLHRPEMYKDFTRFENLAFPAQRNGPQDDWRPDDSF